MLGLSAQTLWRRLHTCFPSGSLECENHLADAGRGGASPLPNELLWLTTLHTYCEGVQACLCDSSGKGGKWTLASPGLGPLHLCPLLMFLGMLPRNKSGHEDNCMRSPTRGPSGLWRLQVDMGSPPAPPFLQIQDGGHSRKVR